MIKIFVLADSNFRRKLLPNIPKGVRVDIKEIKLSKFFTIPEKLIASGWNTLRVLNALPSYDAVLSISTLNGTPLLLLQKFTRLISIPHVMIDVALPRFVSPTNKTLIEIARNITYNLRSVICFATGQALFWKKVLRFDNARFVPLGINPPSYRLSGRQGEYIFSAGRADRDYATLLRAIEHLDLKTVIMYGKDQITFKSPSILHQGLNTNVKVMYEVPYKLYEKALLNSLFVVIPLKKTYYASGQVVLLEAMAMGKTVIASKVTGMMDYIENWRTGIFVEPYNVKDLKEKIEYLLQNPDEIKRIGRNARYAVEKHFTEKKMTTKIVDVIKSSIN